MDLKKLRRIGLVIGALLIVSTLWLQKSLEKKEEKSPSLPVLGEVPEFVFFDSKAQEFSYEELKGKVWVADFIFTSCSGICPIMTNKMSYLHKNYLLEKDVRMVSISVDPETDSPQVLDDFANKYEADTEKWHFLTGATEKIHKLAVEGFKIGSVEDPVMHSAKFVLVDKNMKIRGYYDGTEDKEVEKLLGDILLILDESEK